MKLKPVIASYSGGFKIQQYLTDNVLDIIATVAQSPQPNSVIARGQLAELEEMHVLTERDGWIKLSTAVFLKSDIESIIRIVTPLANEVAQLIQDSGRAFLDAPAEITIFLGGIIGIVQGVGMNLNQKDAGIWEWKSYEGKYARSKVDFDEICEVYEAIGPDYLNKTVLQGERYTAVFIGPQGNDFKSLAYSGITDQNRDYITCLNRYLVDTYAMLATDEMRSASLLAAAEAANMYKQGKPRTAVITHEHIREYEEAIQAIIEVVYSYYAGKQHIFDELLRSTTSGKQGVTPSNMAMNFWRYIRKATAKALYANGFFRDSIPEEGCLTVFYENDIELIRRHLM